MSSRLACLAMLVIAAGALALAGCESITGINDFTVQKASDGGGVGESGADDANADVDQEGAVGEDAAAADSETSETSD
ncbi:MAG: hypothetical protein HY898_20625 [Deltaproteobacteria bacterium]|nr:hypothetical protein [Deltaproteobacteria bacterium]